MKVPKLQQVRNNKLMTQVELANKSGVPQTSISHMESGSGAMAATIRALAAALGVEPSELVGAEPQEGS